MLYYERKYKRKGYRTIIGIDEAGIGPLAGPVVAAAVALCTVRFVSRIDDSKKLSCLQREKAYREIIGKSIFGISVINEKVIDRLNIFVATRIAMEEAVRMLVSKLPGLHSRKVVVLVDGLVKPQIPFVSQNIIKGDAKSKSIAAASILAKVTRDRIMHHYDKVFPEYGFIQHKGYPTADHRRALGKYGISPIHRLSYSHGGA